MFFFVCVSWSLYKIYILLHSYVSRADLYGAPCSFQALTFFLFEDPHAKYNTQNAGKDIAKKGQHLPSIMTNATRKCEGLSVVCLNMSLVTLSLSPICLHNQSCMLCAIWPHFPRTPTVPHTTKP